MQPTKVSREEWIAARSGEAPLHEFFVVAGITRYCFSLSGTIKAGWKRIFELLHEMLVVERSRQHDDLEQRTNTGNPIEVYSPIFKCLCGRD